jgi:type II restriction enzyme
LKGLYDLDKREVLVGEEFWNFVAQDNIYEDLLTVFQEVGGELRDEIDEKFAEFRKL